MSTVVNIMKNETKTWNPSISSNRCFLWNLCVCKILAQNIDCKLQKRLIKYAWSHKISQTKETSNNDCIISPFIHVYVNVFVSIPLIYKKKNNKKSITEQTIIITGFHCKINIFTNIFGNEAWSVKIPNLMKLCVLYKNDHLMYSILGGIMTNLHSILGGIMTSYTFACWWHAVQLSIATIY